MLNVNHLHGDGGGGGGGERDGRPGCDMACAGVGCADCRPPAVGARVARRSGARVGARGNAMSSSTTAARPLAIASWVHPCGVPAHVAGGGSLSLVLHANVHHLWVVEEHDLGGGHGMMGGGAKRAERAESARVPCRA